MNARGRVTLAMALLSMGLAGGGEARPRSWRVPDIGSWAYQLQDFDLRELGASRYGLLVLDYSSTGDADGELTREQVRALQQDGPCGRRIVLAYLSIGEAEDYRFYWENDWVDGAGDPRPGAPSFLGPTNPDWAGNYKVRYWQRDWQRILMGGPDNDGDGYLDRILAAGFDGVYLDIIDGYEYWGPEEIGGNGERARAAADMVTLVRRLRNYGRRNGGSDGFLVVPQNGATIIDPEAHDYAADPQAAAAKQRRRYFRAIDAIGAEDTFFFGNRDQNNPLRPQEYTIAWLDQFAAAGKTVLAIDYLTRPAKVDTFWELAGDRGWLPYVSVRDLDRLFTPPGHEPVCE
jgi:cysteinyl-tRNA synthetase